MLLSLVRSNEQGKLGFTAVDNRVCVALSRARLGFYCACNLSMLGDGSELWNKVRKYLRDERRSGGALPLKAPQQAAAVPQYLREEEGGREVGEVAAPLDPEAGGLGDPGGVEAGWRAAWEHGLEGLRHLASGTVATAAAGAAPRLAPCERRMPCGHQCSRLCHLLEESSSVQCMCERCLPSDEVRDAETWRWRALQTVLSVTQLFGAAATTDAPDVVSPNPRMRRGAEGATPGSGGGGTNWSTIVEQPREMAGEERTAAAWAAAQQLVGHGSDGRYGGDGGGAGAPASAPAPAPAPAPSRLRAGAGAKPGAVADASRGSVEAAGTIAPQPTRAPYPTKTFLTSTTGSSPPRARPVMQFGGANPQGADVRASSGFAITTAATAPVARPASPPPPRQHKRTQRTSRSPSPQPVPPRAAVLGRPGKGSKPAGRDEGRREKGGGAAGGGAAEAPLPEGWEVRMSDRAGRSFYFHRATKTKTWHHAEMLATVQMHAAREAAYSPSPPAKEPHRSRRRDTTAGPEAEAKAEAKRHKRSRGEGERRGSGKAKSSPQGFTY